MARLAAAPRSRATAPGLLTRRSALFLPALAALLAALPARAQDADAPPPPPPLVTGGFGIPNPSSLFGNQAGIYGGIGFGQLGSGDWWLQATADVSFSIGPVSLGLALPIDLLVWNDDSSGCASAPVGPCSRSDKAYGGILRRRDWDELSDYARLIRYVQYGHKRDAGFYGLFGQEWDSSIGHGTIVSHYNNSLQLDHPKAGLAFDYNGQYWGIETLTDELTGPDLIAARAYVRPFGGTPVLRGWAIGATFAADIHAPRALVMQSGPNGLQLAQDSTGSPIVAWEQVAAVWGMDTEYELLSNSFIHLIPYLDLNRIAGAGNGAHLGIMTQILLPIPILDVRLDAKLEYRWMQSGYIPEYFDQVYDLGRVQYARIGPSGLYYEPKAQAAREMRNDPNIGNQGYYGELGFNFAGWVQVGGSLADSQSDDGGSLGLYVTLPKIKFLKVQGYYLRKNFAGLADAFTLDERSLLGGSVAYAIYGPLYLRLDYQRTWALNPNDQHIEAVSTYNIGVATSFSF